LSRSRACAAIIKNGLILMVLHQRPERSYWTLPGGGIEPGETPEQAAIREVMEEAGMEVRIVRLLYVDTITDWRSYCFLAEPVGPMEPLLGIDPEEINLPPSERILKGLSWHSLKDMQADKQISKVISTLGLDVENC
jgi:8-oxo-dGTP diphosphatase